MQYASTALENSVYVYNVYKTVTAIRRYVPYRLNCLRSVTVAILFVVRADDVIWLSKNIPI